MIVNNELEGMRKKAPVVECNVSAVGRRSCRKSPRRQYSVSARFDSDPLPITGPRRYPMITCPLCCSEVWLIRSEDMRGQLFIYLSIYLSVYLFIYLSIYLFMSKGVRHKWRWVQHSRESRWWNDTENYKQGVIRNRKYFVADEELWMKEWILLRHHSADGLSRYNTRIKSP